MSDEAAIAATESEVTLSLPAESADAAAQPRPRRPDTLYHVVLLTICSAVISLALVLSVRAQTQVVLPVLGSPLPELCMMRRYTGVGCPGCGMTRCFISLAHGDWRGAMQYNFAGPLLFAMMAFQIPFRTVQLWRIRRGMPEFYLGVFPQVLFGILGVLMVGQWLLRFAGIGF
jgi:hypothetical protein